MWDHLGRHLEWNLQAVLQKQRSIVQHRGLKDFESVLLKRISSKQTISFHALYWALMEALERPASPHMVDDCEHFTAYHRIHRPWAKYKAASFAMKIVKDLDAENAGMERLPTEIANRLPQLQLLIDRCNIRSTRCALRRHQLERYRTLTKSYMKKITDSKAKEAELLRRIEELKIEAEFLGHEESDLLKEIAQMEEDLKEDFQDRRRPSDSQSSCPLPLEWSASLDTFPPRNGSSIRPCPVRIAMSFTPRIRTRVTFLCMWFILYVSLCELVCPENVILQAGLLALFMFTGYSEM